MKANYRRRNINDIQGSLKSDPTLDSYGRAKEELRKWEFVTDGLGYTRKVKIYS